MILEILLIVIACLLALLLYWFYCSLLVAVLQKAHPEMDLTLWQLSELNEGLTQFELWKALHSDQNIADQKLSEYSPNNRIRHQQAAIRSVQETWRDRQLSNVSTNERAGRSLFP